MNAAILEKFKHFKLFIKITFESFFAAKRIQSCTLLEKEGNLAIYYLNVLGIILLMYWEAANVLQNLVTVTFNKV